MSEMDEDLNPQPRAWPACSECGVAFVLRRAVTFKTLPKSLIVAEEWVWQRDCKHKKAKPITQEPNGAHIQARTPRKHDQRGSKPDRRQGKRRTDDKRKARIR